ncbi:MAG: hypothetical protein NTZ57_02075 [Deltaproteobacteria bacterium]|nr:hypothetical protein [Deltaproteobacteria bacterium]
MNTSLPRDSPSNPAKATIAALAKKFGYPPNFIYSVLGGEDFRVITAIIIGQFSRAVENGQGAIQIAMNPQPGPDVTEAIWICRDLQLLPLEADSCRH